jgi:branched-chain amino acid transport system substrate-binding protein
MKKKIPLAQLVVGLAGLFAAGSVLSQATQGVTKNEIVIATITDLSGPISYVGRQTRNGMQMRVDEINAAGGINGRKLRLLVEDNGYDPKRSVLAAQKLVNSDNVFAILYHAGSAMNIAAMPILFERNVINFMPASGSRAMFEPPDRLKIAMTSPNFDQIEVGVPFLIKQKKHTKVCAIYQDDEFGQEHLRGAEAGLKKVNLALTERVTYKRGSTDFSSQVAKTKQAGCTMVVLGALVRETVGILSEARKNDYNPDFLAGESGYTAQVAELGGAAVENLYAVHAFNTPYADDSSKAMRDFYAAYKAKYNEGPQQLSMYSYYVVDVFAKAAAKAGPNLTTDSFLNVMETTIFPNVFGGGNFSISKTDRLGIRELRVSQIQKGRWVNVSELLSVR